MAPLATGAGVADFACSLWGAQSPRGRIFEAECASESTVKPCRLSLSPKFCSERSNSSRLKLSAVAQGGSIATLAAMVLDRRSKRASKQKRFMKLSDITPEVPVDTITADQLSSQALRECFDALPEGTPSMVVQAAARHTIALWKEYKQASSRLYNEKVALRAAAVSLCYRMQRALTKAEMPICRGAAEVTMAALTKAACEEHHVGELCSEVDCSSHKFVARFAAPA